MLRALHFCWLPERVEVCGPFVIRKHISVMPHKGSTEQLMSVSPNKSNPWVASAMESWLRQGTDTPEPWAVDFRIQGQWCIHSSNEYGLFNPNSGVTQSADHLRPWLNSWTAQKTVAINTITTDKVAVRCIESLRDEEFEWPKRALKQRTKCFSMAWTRWLYLFWSSFRWWAMTQLNRMNKRLYSSTIIGRCDDRLRHVELFANIEVQKQVLSRSGIFSSTPERHY